MRTHLIAPVILVALLAACGSGSDDEVVVPPPPVVSNEVPGSATASILAYSQYAGSLVASDSSEPLDVSKVVPPTSETEEPIVVN